MRPLISPAHIQRDPMAGVQQSAPATPVFDERLGQCADGFSSVSPSFHEVDNAAF
jgi:hypothetical protein